jgi:hypothetical protein
MMGSRGCKGGWEYDVFARYWRRYAARPRALHGLTKAIKRKYWKRHRREARQRSRAEAAE